MEALAAQSPDIRRLLNEHLQDYDELLPHVFFGELTAWFEERWPKRHEQSTSTEIQRVLGQLELGLADGDDAVQNVIAVSFIENLWELWTDAEFLALLGPKMKHELITMRDWYDTHGRSS